MTQEASVGLFVLPMLRYKYIRPELKLVDAKRGLFDAVVMSDESQDRDGDIIRQKFWDLTDFEKHPALVASHEYRNLLNQIGEWKDLEVRGKKLWGTPQYYVGEGNEQADWAFNLALKGRAAYSVAFMPDWDKAIELEGADEWFPSYEFRGQSLLETSQVVIPSNPNALQHVKGISQLHPIVSAIVDEALAETSDDSQQATKANDPIALSTIAETVSKVFTPVFDELLPMVNELLVVLCGPIASHSTATSEDAWDGPANEARLSNDAGASTYRKAYAWVDSDKDANTKAAYKFIHHMVDSGGAVGAANIVACSTGIGILNGGRGGTNIPEADRKGVYNHLARHLRDAGRDVPELRSLGLFSAWFTEKKSESWLPFLGQSNEHGGK